jgi:uncharacterized RmlC-like cupin family protein
VTSRDVRVVKTPAEGVSRQALAYFAGICEQTCGATGISMSLVAVPPGGAAEPHSHDGYETAIYVLEGTVETRYGDGLRKRAVSGPGDFVFIPPGVPHQPVNTSGTDWARALVARNDANEHERVVPYEVECGLSTLPPAPVRRRRPH